ncbi:MAG: YfbM family protein [Gemmatimonadota bacterium]
MSMIGCFAAVDPSQVDALCREPELLMAHLEQCANDPTRSADVDKAWHAIHFMLAGDPDGGEAPAASVVLGGVEVGEDLGYGPARLLTSEEVREIGLFLQGMPPEQFSLRYAPAEMDAAEIYPVVWVEDGEEGREYVAHAYERLRKFYLEAAARGDSVVAWLT